ncbi:MAG: VOC family protein [Anaerolineae bacterium]
MFNRVTAVVLFVQDFEACLAFYRDKLGLEVALLESDFAAFRFADQDFALQAMPTAVELFGALPERSTGSDRAMLCTKVADVDAAYQQFRANGVEFTKAPEDKYWGIRAAYFRDPEGNLWEIATPIAK